MTSVTRTLFGGSKEKTRARPVTIPRLPAVAPNLRTAAGSRLGTSLQFGRQGKDGPFGLTGVGINAALSPEIAALREERLAGTRDLLGDVSGDIERLRGLENPFMRARTQPFIEERERAARAAARRGVSGPLAALATNPYTARIADAATQATFDTQTAIRQGQEMTRALLSDISGEGQALLAQELELLGLSQQQIRDIVGSQLEQTVAQEQRGKATQQRGLFPGGVPGLAGFVGGLLS